MWFALHFYLGHILLKHSKHETKHIDHFSLHKIYSCYNMEVHCPGPEVIKLFSCSTQLSMKFQLLIKTKIPANKEVSCFKSLRCCIYHANKCLNANNCRHFNIYEQDKFRAQLS